MSINDFAGFMGLFLGNAVLYASGIALGVVILLALISAVIDAIGLDE